MHGRWMALVAVLSVRAALSPEIRADEWNTWRGGIDRGGVLEEALPAGLGEAWVFQSKYPPQPAWPGPARRDGWHKVDNLKPRVIFDWAFHVVASDGSLFFGSSADDKVYCLDAATGAERWHFFAEAPVRLAPMVSGGKVYFGSDDGRVYCLSAETGELAWDFQAAPRDYRVPGNGRMMSLWPVRSGVLVDGGIAYFCSGLFPNEGINMFALDAETGDVIWKTDIGDLPPQGYLLASPTRLYVPTGRGTPAVFDRSNGKFIHQVGGSGGAFAVLTGDTLISGPGKTGQLDAYGAESKDYLATFQGNQIIIAGARAYLHSDTELQCIDRERQTGLIQERNRLGKIAEQIEKYIKSLGENVDTENGRKARADLRETRAKIAEAEKAMDDCVLWKTVCKHPYSLILAGNTLYAGGTGAIAAFEADTGGTLWTKPVNGRALELAAANGRLFASTDRGAIHCFAGQPE